MIHYATRQKVIELSSIGAVNDRLFFAKQRFRDLELLNSGDLAGANISDRQQLIQEFFFHLVGSIEFIAQVINTSKMLNIHPENVRPHRVCDHLDNNDPIKPLLTQLYPRTRNESLPQNPYSDEASHLRILLIRHFVCHLGNNPFHFRQGSTLPRSSLVLDPRELFDPNVTNPRSSRVAALDELNHFFVLVENKCRRIIAYL